MSSFFEDLLKRAIGKAGSITGNEEWQQIGAEAMTPEERIKKSYKDTGKVAIGDYNTAVNMGLVNQSNQNSNTGTNVGVIYGGFYPPAPMSKSDFPTVNEKGEYFIGVNAAGDPVYAGRPNGGGGGGGGGGSPPSKNDKGEVFIGLNANGDPVYRGDPNDAYQKFINEQTNTINSQFDSYFSDLDRRMGLLPEEQRSQEDKLGNLYSSSLTDINAGRDKSIDQLEQSRKRAQEQQVNTLRDLENNLRNSFLAGNTYLGSIGGGSSSASDMLSYALTKAGSKNRTSIQNQAQQIYADIDNRISDVGRTAQDEIKKLDDWKNNQLLDIGDYIREKRNALEQMVSQGRIDKARALQELNTNVFNVAQQRLAQLDNAVMQWNQAIGQWALSRQAQLNDYKASLGQLGNFSAPDLVRQELSGLPQAIGMARQTSPMLFGIRRRDDDNTGF